jgi:transposase InsO family protein
LGKVFVVVISYPFLKVAVSCKMTTYTKFLTPSLNNRRLLDAIGYVPPAEFEKAYYRQQEESADAA